MKIYNRKWHTQSSDMLLNMLKSGWYLEEDGIGDEVACVYRTPEKVMLVPVIRDLFVEFRDANLIETYDLIKSAPNIYWRLNERN